ncbi:hypothetical protein HWB90_gp084 [Mycobacterium phage Fowlmouth]|uniref:Uncharacterized protein n=2 Tax=Fowlmouthvirus fowlmouth TaxID=2845652 RepID=A0A7G8LPZ5_9CAUD|nr:hypothetical protein HWB90_gp084 [Mycobacterium phage Fowlmouth]AYN58055.1 hypothetical protein SEA_FOWLMOUTH_106 [Mycobacterium phage Fowlmouth]QNJ59317.1 hypothetical protein SEA_MRMIYAGI_104 [Mycobacterium phage MrMiyagi]
MNCTCAPADSFNVRVSDLIDPSCPEHGCRLKRCPKKVGGQGFRSLASDQEIKDVLRKNLTEIQLGPGHYAFMIPNADIDSVVRNLRSGFEIRVRK